MGLAAGGKSEQNSENIKSYQYTYFFGIFKSDPGVKMKSLRKDPSPNGPVGPHNTTI